MQAVRGMRGLAWPTAIGFWTALAALVLLASPRAALADDAPSPPVVVADLDGEVSEGMPSAVARAVSEAEELGASHLVVRIRTFGGLVSSATAITDTLLGADVPVVAYVDGRAISAGALIALASEEIYMAPGSQIGAAAPREIGPDSRAEEADEKTVSALRSIFRGTAEARGHDPAIAEAMVDSAVDLPELAPSNRLLTLTAAEAVGAGLADAEARDLDALAAAGHIGDGERVEIGLSPAERLADFLGRPLVSGLLLSLGIFALIFAFKMPGAGLPEIVAALTLGAFLFGKHVAGLAGWEDVALVVVGILFLGLEIFVIPGVGIAAVVGILALGAGLVMASVGHPPASPFFWDEFRGALAMLGVAIGLGALWSTLTYFAIRNTAIWKRFTMRSTLAPTPAPEPEEKARELAAFEGRRGEAKTSLRPEGEIAIAGAVYPARADREYLDPAAAVTVVGHDGRRLLVRRADGDESAAPRDGAAAPGEDARESGEKSPARVERAPDDADTAPRGDDPPEEGPSR